MNGGNSGIVPTIDLATNGNNNGFAYPVYPMMGGFGGNGGFGYGSDWIWIIVLFALFGGWGNNGNNGGFFGGRGFDDGYAWLSNGQKEIMQNTNNGFDTLHLSNQLDTVNSGIYSLSNQLCNCCADMNSTVSNGFYNAEVAACNRQMANMNQLFGISTQIASASADNRLGVQDLKSTVISENCSDREVLRQIGQDILVSQTANTQKIIDEIFRDRLDEKDSKIADLNRQLQMADLRASQIAQTQAITSNIYNELKNCPVGTVPVYGNTPIFTCPNNNGCGCGFNTTSQFI
jgi:hypothetical protein